MRDRILPTADLAFKKAFADPSNKDVLQGAIGDFLGVWPAIEDIDITSPYSVKAYEEYVRLVGAGEEVGEKLRHTVQDVAADIKVAGFGAELQMRADRHFSKRSLYYGFDAFCANYSRPGAMASASDGRPIRYSSLKPVYMLGILGYNHFAGDEDALRVFTLYDRKRGKSFDVEYVTFAYFELGKGRVETENQRHWQAFFKTGEAPEGAPGYIRKAAQVIERANLTREERRMIDKLQKAEDVYVSTIHTAELIGEERGEKKGEERERLAIARRMLAYDKPLEEVVKFTGLSAEEVRKLVH